MSETRQSPIVSKGKALSSCGDGNRPRVLVVDDETVIADTVVEILCQGGYAATAAYDGNSALETALISPPELVITDVTLPGMNGIELAITIKRVYPECQVLLFSGRATTADLVAAASRAGHRFTLLEKPVPPNLLVEMVAERLGATSRQPLASLD